jgi:O-antigen/teichoic acid export membrane protein
MSADTAPDLMQTPRLLHRVVRAGGWTTFGFAGSQLLRLLGNLILTRLLFPEAFGLMAIVQAVIFGMAMLSDVGIEQSIIQNGKGDTIDFLNTAWTLKILRGIAMWLLGCALAVPLARFYNEPMLAQLLPVVGLTAVIAGFASTNIALADRKLGVAKSTLIEMGSSAFGLAVTVAWAWAMPSVWSLVAGSILSAIAQTLASHMYLDGTRNYLAWDREALSALAGFGRWILVSSALTFLVGEGIRLLVGRLLDVRMLAFMTLAMTIAQMPRQFFQQIGGRVLFSAYSEVIRERPERFNAVLARSRLIQIVPHWTICILLVFFGQQLMGLIYDERYIESGWMLQLLAVGSLIGCITNSYGSLLWAKGLVKTSTGLLAVQLLVQVAAMTIGVYVDGPKGLILGLALTSWILYPVHAAVYASLSLWQPKLDLPFIFLSLLTAFIFAIWY